MVLRLLELSLGRFLEFLEIDRGLDAAAPSRDSTLRFGLRMGVGLMIGSAIAFRALSLSFFRLLFSVSRRLSISANSISNSANSALIDRVSR